MTSRTLFRLAALALVVAAPLGPLGHWLHPPGHTAALAESARWVPAHTSVWLWALLTALALPALYACVAPRVGAWALAAFALVFFHLTNAVAAMQREALLVHALASSDSTHAAADAVLGTGGPVVFNVLVMAGGLLGPLLFGLVLLRAGGAWRAPGVAMVASPLLTFALFATGNGFWAFRVGMALGEMAFGWAGLVLWRQAGTPAVVREPAPAAAPAVA